MGRRRYRKKHHCHGEDGPGPERRSGHGAYGYPTYCHPEGPSDRCPSTSPSTDDSPWADTHSYSRAYGGAGSDTLPNLHTLPDLHSSAHGNPGGDRDTFTHGHAGVYGDACSCPNRLAGTDGDTCAYGHASPHGHAGSDRYTCAYRSLRKSTSDY